MLLLAASFVCGAAGADDYDEQMNRLKALDKRCEQARAVKLAPIRDRLVQDCLKDQRRNVAGPRPYEQASGRLKS